MPTKEYSNEQYTADFLNDQELTKKAFERASDVRKFEIELYWRRATYFWALIAATLAGYVAVQVLSDPDKTNMSILLANLGLVFSFGWYCVNRGSKFWQENWEYHVDMLEDKINGPLYKVVMGRRRPSGCKERFVRRLIGPERFSVSKINQLISVFVSIMWLGLLWFSLPPFRLPSDWRGFILIVDWRYVGLIGLTAATCGAFLGYGKAGPSECYRRATKRSVKIKND